MLYGCLFCNMSPGGISALGTHLRLYVDEYAEGHRNAHPSNKSTYATKYDNIHHVGMIRCWIGGRQTNVRIPAVRAVKLAYSKDQAEHSALWRFAKNIDVELQDSQADQWRGRDTTTTVSWWDQRVKEVMAGRTTTTAVVRESRVRAGVPTIGKVVIPTDEENFLTIEDELEFGEWNKQMDTPFAAHKPLIQHGDFSAGHRIRGVSNEIGQTSTGSTGDMITVKHTLPPSQRRAVAVPPHDRSLRSKGPAAALPADTIFIDDASSHSSRPAHPRRRLSRSNSPTTEPDATHSGEAWHAPHRAAPADESDAPRQRTRYREPPPSPFTLHVDVFGRFVKVPITPYCRLSDVVDAALESAGSGVVAAGIRGSDPLVRVDATCFLLIDEWCREWDEGIWSRVMEKAAFLPQPVVWNCELVEARKKKKKLVLGKA